MANSLNQDIANKYVRLKSKTNSAKFQKSKWLTVLVTGGFGDKPFTQGEALFILHVDGETRRVSGYDVERLATQKEIDSFVQDYVQREDPPLSRGIPKESLPLTNQP